MQIKKKSVPSYDHEWYKLEENLGIRHYTVLPGIATAVFCGFHVTVIFSIFGVHATSPTSH